MANGALTPDHIVVRRALGLSFVGLALFVAVAIVTALYGDRLVEAIEKNSALLRASDHEADGKFRLALVEYRRLLEIYPDAREARLRLTWLLLSERQFEEALTHATALDTEEATERDLAAYGEVLLGMGEHGDARAVFDRALAVDAAYRDAVYGQALAAALGGDFDAFDGAMSTLGASASSPASERFEDLRRKGAAMGKRRADGQSIYSIGTKNVGLMIDGLLREGKLEIALTVRSEALAEGVWGSSPAHQALDAYARGTS